MSGAKIATFFDFNLNEIEPVVAQTQATTSASELSLPFVAQTPATTSASEMALKLPPELVQNILHVSSQAETEKTEAFSAPRPRSSIVKSFAASGFLKDSTATTLSKEDLYNNASSLPVSPISGSSSFSMDEMQRKPSLSADHTPLNSPPTELTFSNIKNIPPVPVTELNILRTKRQIFINLKNCLEVGIALLK